MRHSVSLLISAGNRLSKIKAEVFEPNSFLDENKRTSQSDLVLCLLFPDPIDECPCAICSDCIWMAHAFWSREIRWKIGNYKFDFSERTEIFFKEDHTGRPMVNSRALVMRLLENSVKWMCVQQLSWQPLYGREASNCFERCRLFEFVQPCIGHWMALIYIVSSWSPLWKFLHRFVRIGYWKKLDKTLLKPVLHGWTYSRKHNFKFQQNPYEHVFESQQILCY